MKGFSFLLVAVLPACAVSSEDHPDAGLANGARAGASTGGGGGGDAAAGGSSSSGGKSGSGATAGAGGSPSSGGSSSAGNAGTPSGGRAGSGGDGGSSGSAGAAGSSGSGGARSVTICPVAQPVDGALCTGTIGPCSYGDHPLTYCRASAGCANGKWTVTPVPAACTQLPAECPATVPSGTCDVAQSVACFYRTASCSCAVCANVPGSLPCGSAPSGSKVWACSPAVTGNENCPGPTPNQGAPCELPNGTACVTNLCGMNVTCVNGAWKWEYKSDPSCLRVCASPDTPIATPTGERPIEDLRPGDLVYSVEHDGVVVVPIARVRRTPVDHHSVLRIRLAGGRVLEVSGLHPTAEGVPLANLHRGDVLDHTRIEEVKLVPYTHDATYDILPDSGTGTYFAAGVLLGSTLMPRGPSPAATLP